MISGEWGREYGDATASESATKLGLSLGDWDWRTGRRVEIAYLVPRWDSWQASGQCLLELAAETKAEL